MNYVDEIVKESYEKYTNLDYKLNKKLTVTIVTNGYVLPVNKYYNPLNTLCGTGGVLNEQKEYIEQSAMKAYNMSNRLDGKYYFNDKKVKYIDEKVIYLNHFIHHWGHYLLDVIGRLWYLLKEDISEYKIVYTSRLGKNDYIKGNYLELLKLLKIDESNLIMVNEVTRFKEIVVPESSIYPGKYFTQEYIEIFDEILANTEVNLKNNDKIYCSRRYLKGINRKEIGEAKIEKIFNENGYTSVYFEQMSVKEQIEKINSAKEIVAVSGTLPHNLLFARNKAHVTILNKTYKLNLHQFLINQISNCNVDFVDVNISPAPIEYGRGPFIMKITDNLKKYCKYNNLECKDSIDYTLSIQEKVWYYINYIISYRGRIIKDKEIKTKEIRKFYKKRKY